MDFSDLIATKIKELKHGFIYNNKRELYLEYNPGSYDPLIVNYVLNRRVKNDNYINKSLLCNDLFEYMVSFEDVYDMDVSVSNKIDCVFLNYMLSHMAHFNNDSIEVFVNKLVKFVLCNNIHTILYNDIPYVSDNRHWGYHWLEYIAEKLSSDGYKLAKYSYNPNLYSDRKGVVRIENKWPSFVSDNINDACSSISCIIYL